jgi:hypothetical protein
MTRPDHDELREALRADYLRGTEEELRDGLARESLHQMLRGVVRSYLDDLGLAASVGQRIATLETHLSRIEQRAECKRQMVAITMERAEIETIIDPEFTALRSRTRGALVVDDEEAIPKGFWRAQALELDHDALIAALRVGETIPGASLSASEATITVRTR